MTTQRALVFSFVVAFSACAGGGGGSGSGGGSATGGGSGIGGGSATGGGSGTQAAIGTFLRIGMQEHLYAAGPDGSMHMLFNEGYAERIIYGRCSANCADPASWNLSQLLDHTQVAATTIGVHGLVVDATGRVHALVSGVPTTTSADDVVLYATCASNCSDVANWSSVDLGALVTGGVVGVNSGLTVSASGAIGVIGRGAFGNYDAKYAACSSNCTDAANWTAGAVVNGTVQYLSLDGSGVSHILYSAGSTTDGDGLLYYGRCASNCTQTANWQLSSVGFVHGSNTWEAGFTVTPSGRVFLSYNQGAAHLGTENNGHVLVVSCLGAGCTDLSTWSSITLSTDPDEDEVWLAHDGEALGLLSTASLELRARTCDASCEAAASWSDPAVIDSSTAMAAAIAPDTDSSCPGNSSFGAWYPAYPRGAASSKGIIIAHAPYALVTCPGNGNPTREPNIGRVFSTF